MLPEMFGAADVLCAYRVNLHVVFKLGFKSHFSSYSLILLSTASVCGHGSPNEHVKLKRPRGFPTTSFQLLDHVVHCACSTFAIVLCRHYNYGLVFCLVCVHKQT